MEGVQESLAGRVALLQMLPLSQQEILGNKTTPFEIKVDAFIEKEKYTTKADTPEIFKRIFNGGMPALLSGQYTDRRVVYSSYISTYIDRDVKDLSGAINSLKFMNFITATAALAGQMVNYKTISEDCDIDQTTAKSWLRILETLWYHFLSASLFKQRVEAHC